MEPRNDRKKGKAAIAFSAFFKSLGEDIANSFKRHWLGLIGKFSMFVVPLIYILAEYLTRAPSKWALPIFAWIPLIVLLLVYWGKMKSWLAIKVNAMETQNSIQRGKHAGAIILCKILQVACTALPFFLGYVAFAELEAHAVSVKSIFLFVFACEAVGGVFVVLDAIANVVDYSEGEEE